MELKLEARSDCMIDLREYLVAQQRRRGNRPAEKTRFPQDRWRLREFESHACSDGLLIRKHVEIYFRVELFAQDFGSQGFAGWIERGSGCVPRHEARSKRDSRNPRNSGLIAQQSGGSIQKCGKNVVAAEGDLKGPVECLACCLVNHRMTSIAEKISAGRSSGRITAEHAELAQVADGDAVWNQNVHR